MELFKKATLQTKKWRILLRGTSGSGKTTSALMLADALKGKDGKTALVDTEKMSSTHNAKRFDYDIVDFNTVTSNNHTVKNYIGIIDEAEKAGYAVLIIDSFSHAWIGNNGILQQVESLTQTKYRGNSYRAWSEGNEMYQSLIDKILFGNNMHIILTARVKQAYEMTTNSEGRKEVVKKGMEIQQRDGLDYEFDTVLNFDTAKVGYAIPEKDRTGIFEKNGEMITKDTGLKMLDYLSGK